MTMQDRDKFIADKLIEGLSLSDIQKALKNELELDMTYFDLRMIVADLDIDWPTQKEEPEDEDCTEEEVQPEAVQEEVSGCQVEISKIVRPGASLSGDVVFSSGIKAEWFIDSFGRLGLNPENEDDKPTPEDIQEFQMVLQQKLSGGA